MGSIGLPDNPTLSWETSGEATSYEYCITTTSGATCDTGWNSAGNKTQTDLTGLAKGATYYWQVRAVNSGGTTYADNGDWWSFTVVHNVFLPVVLR